MKTRFVRAESGDKITAERAENAELLMGVNHTIISAVSAVIIFLGRPPIDALQTAERAEMKGGGGTSHRLF